MKFCGRQVQGRTPVCLAIDYLMTKVGNSAPLGRARMTNCAIRVIGAVAALMLIFGGGYIFAGHLKGLEVKESAAWAVTLMLIYGLPVLLLSGVLALLFRSRFLRVSIAALTTAAFVGGALLLVDSEALASVAALIGAGATLLLAMLPARNAPKSSSFRRRRAPS